MEKHLNKSSKMIVSILATILVSCLSFIPQGGATAADKPDFIHTAVIGDLGGPYAATVGAIRAAFEDAWEYINEELGGVQGVKVKILVRDMAGVMSVGQSQYNELINIKPKPVFIDIHISSLAEALRARYVEDGVVGIQPGTITNFYPQGNTYSYSPNYPEQLAAPMKWVREHWKEKRNPRMGIITWDTAYGRGILTDEFFAYAKSIGVDIVGTPQLFGVKDVDVGTQLLNLRAEKPDYLVTNTTGGGPLAIKRGCKEMDWNITLLNGGGGDWGTVNLNPPLFEGDITGFYVKSWDETDDPSIKLLMKYFTKNKRTAKERTLFYIVPWCQALIEHHVMTEVVKKYGWEGLNAKNVVAVMNNLKDFAPLDGIGRYSYSEKRRTPHLMRVYKITGGKFLPVSDFFEVPDLMPAKFK